MPKLKKGEKRYIMKSAKFFACALLALFTVSAFADAANVLVSFSTTADKYADGKPVADGEWYALCWSSDGVFEGLNLDCTPVDPNDLVCLMAPLAKDGKCPYTVFQVDSQSPNCKREGKYTVVMLDTRGTDGKPATAGDDGKPKVLNGSVIAANYTAGSATSGTKPEAKSEGGTWTESAVAGDIPQPVIKGFTVINDAKVKIDVEGLVPNLPYTVKMGAAIDKLDTIDMTGAQAGKESTSFIIDKGDAKFFQVTRKPLK